MAKKQSLFGLVAGGGGADIDIVFSDQDSRKQIPCSQGASRGSTGTLTPPSQTLAGLGLGGSSTGSNGNIPCFSLYFDGESVQGKVQIRLKDGKKLEHQGIKIEFIGQIGTPIYDSIAALAYV